MFQPAISIFDNHDEKDIAGNRCFQCFRLEQGDFGFADFAQIVFQTRHIQMRNTSGYDDIVQDAICRELAQHEVPHFDRGVDQFIVIAGAITAEAVPRRLVFRQGCRHAP